MKLYFVWADGVYDQILRDNKANIMFSWVNSKEDKIPSGHQEVMIDSGGYQLQTGIKTTKQISREHYADWLKLALKKNSNIVAYMNLDILNNPTATLENQVYFESRGLSPLPIWHPGDSEKLMEMYCGKYEYVAIGGAVGKSMSRQAIKRIFEWIKQSFPDTKFHFLGMGITGTSVFRSFRPYSTDFSTWTNPTRFGNKFVVEDGGLRERRMSIEDALRIRTDHEFRYQVLNESLNLFKTFGDDIEELDNPYTLKLF